MADAIVIDRLAAARRGRQLEYFTIGWNSVEAIVAVAAGIVAGSISLVGFGIDSIIEVTSGATLLWRMNVDEDVPRRERNERLALRIVGLCFVALAVYIAYRIPGPLASEAIARAQHPRHRSRLVVADRDATTSASQTQSGNCPGKHGHARRRQAD